MATREPINSCSQSIWSSTTRSSRTTSTSFTGISALSRTAQTTHPTMLNGSVNPGTWSVELSWCSIVFARIFSQHEREMLAHQTREANTSSKYKYSLQDQSNDINTNTGWFFWLVRPIFSTKMKNDGQPIRDSVPWNSRCTKDPRWLNNVFLFSTEIWAEQLKKAPCIFIWHLPQVRLLYERVSNSKQKRPIMAHLDDPVIVYIPLIRWVRQTWSHGLLICRHIDS